MLEFVRCAAYNLFIKHLPPVSHISSPSSHLLPFPLGSLIAIFTGHSSRALQGAIILTLTVTSAFPRGLLTCYCVAYTHTISYISIIPPDPSPQQNHWIKEIAQQTKMIGTLEKA